MSWIPAKPSENRTREILEQRKRGFIEKSTQQHVQSFGNGPPNYVTYYHRTPSSSTDPNMGNVYSSVGPDSPVHYARVKDMPLFEFQSDFQSLEQGDFGPEDEFTGTAVVVPDMFEPEVDDYFSVLGATQTYLFKVIDIKIDRMTRIDRYYKIEYKLVNDTIDEIEQQVEAHAVVYPDKYMQGIGLLMEEEHAVDMQTLEYQQFFITRMLYEITREYQIPLPPGNFTYQGKKPVLMELSRTISQNELASMSFHIFGNSLIYEPWTHRNSFEIKRAYYESLFGLVDQGQKTNLGASLTPEIVNKRFAAKSGKDVFSEDYGIYRGNRIKFILLELYSTPTSTTLEVISQDMADRLISNNPYEDDQHFFEDLLIKRVHATDLGDVVNLLKSQEDIERTILEGNRDNFEMYVYLVFTALIVKQSIEYLKSQIVDYLPN